MAIHIPGIRDRHNKPVNKGTREVVATLSLTAMVDMFTVLVVFLLQNYTVEVIPMKDTIDLPAAQAIKKLAPATVVAVSETEIFVDNTVVGRLENVRSSESWMITGLKDSLNEKIKTLQDEAKSGLKNSLRKSVTTAKTSEEENKILEEEASRVTVQAYKKIDFLTLKKILFTVTEAGASEINFAVAEKAKEKH